LMSNRRGCRPKCWFLKKKTGKRVGGVYARSQGKGEKTKWGGNKKRIGREDDESGGVVHKKKKRTGRVGKKKHDSRVKI